MVNGRKYTKRFDVKADAVAWTQKMLLSVHEGDFIASSSMSTGEWLLYFLKTYKCPILKPTTYQRYVFTAIQAEPIASIPMQKLTSGEVQSFYNKLSPNAAKKMHVLLHSAFRKAKDLDMIRKNPIHMVQPPKAVKKKIEIFTPEELRKILDTMQSHKTLAQERERFPSLSLSMNT